MKFKTLKASEYCDSVRDGTHDSPKKVEKGYKLITSKNIKEYGLNLENASDISEEDYKKVNERSLVEKNDVLYSMIGTIGLIHRVNYEPNYAIKNMGLFKIKDEQKSKWLYYYLKTPKMKNYINSLLAGSTQQYITLNNLRELPIQIPEDIQDTNKILHILELLENKIANNTHTNNNLYKILDNIFKEKYLNNERYNLWEEITLGEITSKVATGLNPRKNFVLGHGSNYYVTIKNMQNNDVILNGKCDKVDDEAILKINRRSDLKVGDLLFSGIGTIGRVYLIKDVPYNWNISESIFTIRPNEKCSSEFLYLLLLNKNMQNYAMNKASGSVQKGIRMADLKQFKVKLPTDNEMQSFTDVIKPIIDRIYNKAKQNEKLEQIRDTLLSKLMNGEIDLDKIEI